MERKIDIYIRIAALGAFMLAASACSTTKRLGGNDVLYTGVKKIDIESVTGEDVPGSVESAVKDPVSVKPNNPLYSPYVRTPFPIGLWAWNYLYTDKKGIKRWLYRTLAKQPVLISDVKPELRVRLVEDILDNLGYFGSRANYELIEQHNPKKSRISYNVEVAEPWVYGNVEYPEVQGPVTRAIKDMQATSNIKLGEQYNIDTLTRERVRITNRLREQSYYYFRPEYIEYLADTVAQRLEVDLRMVLAQGIPQAALQPYDIGDISVSLFNNQGAGRPDSTVYNGMKVWFQQPRKIRPKILARALTVRPGQPARLSDINTTLTNLNRLGIFRYVNMEVTPLDSLKPGDKMDMKISAAFDQPLEAELEVDFSHKSSSFIGPGAMFSVKNKNFFHGGEVFSVRLNGAYEWQTGNSNAGSSLSMNSYEAGINTSLAFPRLLAPKFIPRNRYGARTTFNLGVSLLRRAGFFSMSSFNLGTSYDFQTSRTSYHNLTLFKFTYNHTFNKSDKFMEIIPDSSALARSFANQFIPSASYTYTWNASVGHKKENRIIWSSTAMTAGNIIAGIWSLAGKEKPGKIFGSEFSQFVKLTTEIRYYKKVGSGDNSLAMRFYAGAAHPYGNNDVLPYAEQFYIGGANSIRAFTIRSIGPGDFVPDKHDNRGYFDQTGEMKLEANIEFRFGIVGGLKGAVFLDAGNIWLLKKDPSRPGGTIGEGNFFKEIATGTGAGLRYDLQFLVLRFDTGIGIHLPYNTGKKGYYNIPKFKDGLGYHLAIGYPF